MSLRRIGQLDRAKISIQFKQIIHGSASLQHFQSLSTNGRFSGVTGFEAPTSHVLQGVMTGCKKIVHKFIDLYSVHMNGKATVILAYLSTTGASESCQCSCLGPAR